MADPALAQQRRTIASTDRKPITKTWGWSPSGARGRAPDVGELKRFCLLLKAESFLTIFV